MNAVTAVYIGVYVCIPMYTAVKTGVYRVYCWCIPVYTAVYIQKLNNLK